jgi:hypothetical protein
MDPRLRPPTGGLLEIMRENARKLCEIRKICNKVAVIRNMGQQPPGVFYSPILVLTSRYINLHQHPQNLWKWMSMLGAVR